MLKSKHKKSKTKLRLIIGLSLVAILAVCGYLFYRHNHSTQSISNTINYGPPSKSDAEDVNNNKQRIVDENNNPSNSTPTDSSGKKAVKPVITYAGQYGDSIEVGGYVNLFEEGGTCTATFTHGSITITKSVAAVRDASSVDCPVMAVPVSQFTTKGSYSVSVSYISNSATGVSDARQIEVK
jgi:hypothetical protein